MNASTTRDQLIQAMGRSLRSRGFGATSMKDVLDTAGVSSGSMYHFFPGGKEELAAAAIRDAGLGGGAAIRRVLADASSAAEGVGRIFDALIQDLERAGFRFGCPIGVPATEAAAVSDEIRAACQDVFNAWVSAYGEALVEEGWAEPAAAAQALAIVTAYEGSITIARALQDTTPISNTRDDLVARVARDGHQPTTRTENR